MTPTPFPSPRDRQHTRDRDGAVRTLAVAAHARGQEATGMWERGESGLPASGPLDRMIRVQMGAYPSDWSDADKREMAEIHLFGRK